MESLNRQNNFIYLTAALVGLLLVAAVLDSLPEDKTHMFLQAMIFVMFAIAHQSLNFGPLWRHFVLVLVVLLIFSGMIYELADFRFSSFLDLVILLLFFLGAAYRASRQVLFSGRVDSNIIVGSIALYLLLGLIWATIYLVVLEISPTAINGIEYQAWADNFSIVAYFSYVTLATLGYGDMSPAEPLSRVLVYLQAVTGVFYMAIVVASLVGAHKSEADG